MDDKRRSIGYASVTVAVLLVLAGLGASGPAAASSDPCQNTRPHAGGLVLTWTKGGIVDPGESDWYADWHWGAATYELDTGSGDADLFVYDRNCNLLCSDRGGDGRCVITDVDTSQTKIEVRETFGGPVSYTLTATG